MSFLTSLDREVIAVAYAEDKGAQARRPNAAYWRSLFFRCSAVSRPIRPAPAPPRFSVSDRQLLVELLADDIIELAQAVVENELCKD